MDVTMSQELVNTPYKGPERRSTASIVARIFNAISSANVIQVCDALHLLSEKYPIRFCQIKALIK